MVCLNCKYTCPAGVDLSQIIHSARERLVERGYIPEIHKKLLDSIAEHGNPFTEPAEKRADVYPKGFFEPKEKAETLLFLGCVSSYQDLKIVPAMMKMADLAAETISPPWAGMRSAADTCLTWSATWKAFGAFREEAAERIKQTGAKRLVATCAGLLQDLPRSLSQVRHGLWRNPGAPRHRIHGRIHSGGPARSSSRKKARPLKAAYHDPCDIGRHMGIYEPPRNILKALPGVELVEFPLNRNPGQMLRRRWRGQGF